MVCFPAQWLSFARGASGVPTFKRCSGVIPAPRRASLRIPIGPNLNVGRSLGKSISRLSQPSDSSRLIETSSLSNHLDSSPPSVPVGAKAFTQNLTPAPYEPAKINRSSRCLPLLRQSYAQSLLRFPRCQEACGGMGSRTGTYHIVEYEQSIQQFFDLCSWGNRACKVSKPEGNSAGCLASWASEAGAQ